MEVTCNNGNVIARQMHQQDLLKDGLSCDDYYKTLKASNPDCKWLDNDNFWEDFSYTAEELGYKMKC